MSDHLCGNTPARCSLNTARAWPSFMNAALNCAPVRSRTDGSGPRRRRRLLVVLLALAAELLELGEHGADVEIAARFLLGLRCSDFRFLARGGFGGRQQGGAGIDRQRLFLVGAVDLDIQVGLRAQAESHPVSY